MAPLYATTIILERTAQYTVSRHCMECVTEMALSYVMTITMEKNATRYVSHQKTELDTVIPTVPSFAT